MEGSNYMAEEVYDELIDRSEKDEFVQGSTHTGQLPDDITEAIETLFFLKGMRNVTINIRKTGHPGDPFLSFTVIDRG